MLDRHTETIAHFVGQFDQSVEAMLLRLNYDELRAQIARIDDPAKLLNVEVDISSEMILDPFNPYISYYPQVHYAPPHDFPLLRLRPDTTEAPQPVTPDTPYPSPHMTLYMPTQAFIAMIEGLPPGAWIAITSQSNMNSDNDILLMQPLAFDSELLALRSAQALDAEFDALLTFAVALSPIGGAFEFDPQPLSIDRFDALIVDLESLSSSPLLTLPQVSAFWSGDHAPAGMSALASNTILVDGVAADAAPEALLDRLEARNSASEEDAPEEDATGSTDLEHNAAAQAGGETAQGQISQDPATYEEDAGLHSLVQTITMGDNLLMNEFSVSQTGLDAAHIIVGGTARDLTVITQVNVASDKDTILAEAETVIADATTSLSNVAILIEEEFSRDGPLYPVPAEFQGKPAAYLVSSIEGDLTLVSQTIQINVVSDNDIVSFETTFHSFEVGTGENIAANAAMLQGFQTGFDMILVNGDMLSLASVQQFNLLFDDDFVLADPGTTGVLSTSDNFLWNQAKITKIGVDKEVDMSHSAKHALKSLSKDKFDANVFDSDPVFQDFYVPQILTIGGDFVTEHSLIQINMLADADTLQLLAGAFADSGMSRVDLSTGGNTLANLAELKLNGVDSDVMAAKGVYSDSVLYQAGMYDLDADCFDMDLGDGSLNGLASEAVAFLADGMLDTDKPYDMHKDCGAGGADSGSGSATFDTLHSMVA